MKSNYIKQMLIKGMYPKKMFRRIVWLPCQLLALALLFAPLHSALAQQDGGKDVIMRGEVRADRVLEQLKQGRRPKAGAVNFLLSYLNVPNHVWATPWHSVIFTTSVFGDIGQLWPHDKTHIRAFNGSFSDTKVRVQALFGGAIIHEFDIPIPAGQTRTIIPEDIHIQIANQDKPLPNVLLFASDIKLVLDGHIRSQEIVVGGNHDTLGLQEARANLNIEYLDCNDLLNYAHACLSPVTNTAWDELIPGS